MTLMLFLIGLAAASSQVDLGGAADAGANLTFGAGGLGTTAGLRQVEGDLRWRAGVVTTQVELDVIAAHLGGSALDAGFGEYTPWAVTVRPEVVTVAVDAGSTELAAGLAPGIWRVEAVDGWDNAMATWSGVEALTPGEVLGGTLTLGGGKGVAKLVAGLDVGQGFNVTLARSFLADVDPMGPAWTARNALVTGLRGEVGGEIWTVGGGVYGWPGLREGAFEASGRVAWPKVALQGEGVLGYNGPSGASAQVELFPEATLGAAVRGSVVGGAVRAGLGVAFRPAEWAVVKVEAGADAGVPYGAVEAAVFSGWPR